MDWIDEKLLGLKDKLKMQSLKKSLSIYLVIAVIAVIITYFVTIKFCNGWENLIYQKYSLNTSNQIPISYFIDLESVYVEENDMVIIKAIEGVKKFSILIYSIIAIVVTTDIFYKNKIREPISILKEEAKHISRNDLNFSCLYISGDEMGDICEAFEKMRIELIKNNQTLWGIMDDQRQLNSAFAHDLRTPLTVIQGYVDLLVKYYPEGKISEEKLIENLGLIQSQVHRLKDFSETMKNIHTFDSIEVSRKRNNLDILDTKIREITKGLEVNNSFKIDIKNNIKDKVAYFDLPIVLQVVDNLLSNAISYAVKNIDITLEVEENFLIVYIRDDGKGFSQEELYSATRPYYSSRKNASNHYGIGLTICKVLCEKHSGNLNVNNSTKGGAIVSASFCIL